ncbi:hypothetical protein HYH03_011285 [Edaphochlamys debaryana]|uniref:TFIIS central domain-containing protein n=1 Tax=Edaphochlamys debaryana TaxID=47281 RepID=A0A835XUG2_9CHLO|nr:hypothetical protein HYH03_011285 [Edaphochlamys debaryana]|eukprot:KAG2490336.1 hypothetical protein HYH03_011285 [Edaphochlamys debaryana]
MSKRKNIWAELDLPAPKPQAKKALTEADKARQEAEAAQLRSNCRRTLLGALSLPPAAPEEGSGPGSEGDEALQPAELAEAIEGELFRHHGSTAGQEYKAAARTLVASLKRNPDLRRRLLQGRLLPPALVALDPRALATSQQQEEYARLQEQGTRAVTLAGRGSAGVVTSEYCCGRCGGRQCDYLDSGRRDIGKCETWGSQDGAGTSRTVTCLGCGHKWEVDDV